MKTLEKSEADLYKYKIFETEQFLKDLEEIGGSRGKKIYKKIENYIYPQIKENPYCGLNIKKLKNFIPPTWRYRIGDYRLFYEIDDGTKIISVTSIETRQNAYG
ncbi:MAG: type II toxin-antitoxin system RelE/ParE family toxin [bacterium]